jgi:hypothetical protein
LSKYDYMKDENIGLEKGMKPKKRYKTIKFV